MAYLQLFVAFLIPGLMGFGGGPGSIAIIQDVTVNTFGYMNTEEFNEIVSIANALPGPIGTKLAAAIGYLELGIPGLIIAIIAIMVPSIIMVICLYDFLIRNREDYRSKRISKFIMPLVLALFINITFGFLIQSFTGINNYGHTIFLLVATGILYGKFNVHPLILILASMAYGYFII